MSLGDNDIARAKSSTSRVVAVSGAAGDKGAEWERSMLRSTSALSTVGSDASDVSDDLGVPIKLTNESDVDAADVADVADAELSSRGNDVGVSSSVTVTISSAKGLTPSSAVDVRRLALADSVRNGLGPSSK